MLANRITRIPACFGCLLLCTSISAAAETVTVDLGADAGEVLHRASGFLHGFSYDGLLPPDAIVVPLKIRLYRTRAGATWSQAERMKKLGIRQQVVISDGWGYGKAYPGDDGKWTKWEDFVTHTVAEAQRRGLKPQWDIWNEPDHPYFWKRTPEQFNETWRRGYLRIRQADPKAEIVGPSWSNVHPGQPRFAEFVRYCKENKVVPDYLCWHFPNDMVKEADECRKLINSEDLHVKGIMVNEYCGPEEQYAGKTAWLIAQIERAKIDSTCHAIWSDEETGSMDGIVFDIRKAIPKGQWWAYERYAALSGRLVATVPGRSIDLVASRDEHDKSARVLLGNRGGTHGEVTVHFVNVHQAAYLLEGDRIPVIVEQIPEDDGGQVTAVQRVVDVRLPIHEDALDVKVPWNSDRDAFAIRLGPNR